MEILLSYTKEWSINTPKNLDESPEKYELKKTSKVAYFMIQLI